MEPVNLLLFASKVTSEDSNDMVEGIYPVMELEEISKYCNLFNNPIDVGITYLNLLFSKLKYDKLETFPSAAGMLP